MSAAVRAQVHSDERSSERLEANLESTIRSRDERALGAVIDELSATGFRVRAWLDAKPGSLITIGLAGVGRRRAEIIWKQAGHAGCEFDIPLSAAELRHALAAENVIHGTFSVEQGDPHIECSWSGKARFAIVALVWLVSWLSIAALIITFI